MTGFGQAGLKYTRRENYEKELDDPYRNAFKEVPTVAMYWTLFIGEVKSRVELEKKFSYVSETSGTEGCWNILCIIEVDQKTQVPSNKKL